MLLLSHTPPSYMYELMYVYVGFVLKTRSHVALAGHKLAVKLRLALNS